MKTITPNRLRSALQTLMICFCMLYLSQTVQAMGDHLTLMQRLETAPVIVAGRVENMGAEKPDHGFFGNGRAQLNILARLKNCADTSQITIQYNPDIREMGTIPIHNTWHVAFLKPISPGLYAYHQEVHRSGFTFESEDQMLEFAEYLRSFPGFHSQNPEHKRIIDWFLAGWPFPALRGELRFQLEQKPLNSPQIWFELFSRKQELKLWNHLQNSLPLTTYELWLPKFFVLKHPEAVRKMLLDAVNKLNYVYMRSAMQACIEAFPDTELEKIYRVTDTYLEETAFGQVSDSILNAYRQSFIETARKNLKNHGKL